MTVPVSKQSQIIQQAYISLKFYLHYQSTLLAGNKITDIYLFSKPCSSTKTNVEPTVASSDNSTTDKNEDDCNLLRGIIQEFEFKEEKDPPIYAKP